MTPNKNRSRKYWVLMSIQFSDIYMLRKYIYIIHIYIYTRDYMHIHMAHAQNPILLRNA